MPIQPRGLFKHFASICNDAWMVYPRPLMNVQSMLKHIANKYNSTTHNTIQIEPNKVTLPSNF